MHPIQSLFAATIAIVILSGQTKAQDPSEGWSSRFEPPPERSGLNAPVHVYDKTEIGDCEVYRPQCFRPRRLQWWGPFNGGYRSDHIDVGQI